VGAPLPGVIGGRRGHDDDRMVGLLEQCVCNAAQRGIEAAEPARADDDLVGLLAAYRGAQNLSAARRSLTLKTGVARHIDGGYAGYLVTGARNAAVVGLVLTAGLISEASAQVPPLPPLPVVPPAEPSPPGSPPSQERPPGPGPGTGDVVSYRGNPQRTESSNDDSVFGPLARLWTRNLNGPASQPLIVEGRVVVNVTIPESRGSGSEVVALDPATGKELWRQPIPGKSSTAPIAIDGDRVISANADGAVRAFALSDGRPLWTTEVRSGGAVVYFVMPPVALKGTIFLLGGAAGGPRAVYALDTNSGAVRWSQRVLVDYQSGMPALDDERVLVSDTCGRAEALRQSDGASLWSREPRGTCTYSTAGIVHDGQLFTGGPQAWVYDIATGADRGRLQGGPLDGVVSGLGLRLRMTSPPGIGDRTTISAVDLATGRARWAYKKQGTYEPVLRPIGVGETVFAITATGLLVGLDRRTGALRSSIPMSSGESLTVAGGFPGMSAGHGLLVATAGSVLQAYAPVLRPSGGGIDMAATAFDLTVGKRVGLVGGLGARLRSRGPRRVELEADRYPFGSYARIARTRTFPDGTAYFTDRPTRNTRYRVRLPRATASPPLSIYAYPRSNFAYRPGRTRLGLRVSLSAGPDFRVGGRRLVVYLLRHKSHNHPRLGSGRLIQTGRGRARAVMSFPYPRRVSRKDGTIWCVKGLRGYGRPDDPFSRRCGAPVVRYGEG
jgi:outer membrane protein assembly factor BamB